jgi:hypothetical protein
MNASILMKQLGRPYFNLTNLPGAAPPKRNSLIVNDLPFKKTLKKRLTLTLNRVILLEVSERKQPKVRKQVKWNTGERIHKTKKGKGSYDRKEDKPKEDN